MHLYINKCFILLFLPISLSTSNIELKVSRKGLVDTTHCSIGLQFLVEVNNTSTNDDFEVELKPDECCLVDDNDVDCGSLEIIGACHGVVKKESTKSFVLVAPLLDPYQRKGYCNIFLDSSPDKEKYIMRDRVIINFDTKLDDREDSDITVCQQIDQDPLNECKPVNCGIFYNDYKTHYNRIKRRCSNVPVCLSKSDTKYPVIIYNPVSNECTDNVISNRDIDSIKSLNSRKRSRFPKDIVIIRNDDNNDKDSLSYNDTFSDSIYDMPPDHTLDHPSQLKTIKTKCTKPLKKFKKKGKHAIIFGFKHISRWAIMGLVIMIFIQCCIIFSMVFCLIKKYKYWKQNKDVVNTYYNYRHDASVTTPLIDTSNIDTNTNQPYSSESSTNIQNKVKHYKSIQKEEIDNVKKSLSDDILSKCINRRNWIRNNKFNSAPNNSVHASNAQRGLDDSKHTDDKPRPQYQTNFTMKDSMRTSDTRLNFENENSSKIDLINKTVTNLKKSIVQMTTHNNLSSEKEIKCTSYNNAQSKSSNLGALRKHSPKNIGHLQIGNYAPSIEKGTQAYFSNDSIDDFISERGMMFFAGDDTSKYTLSSESIPLRPSSGSGTSNKTSKDNIVSNVLSLLRLRSKHGPNSDPGVKSTEKSLDVQFLHISTNSVYSSTNNEMEMLVNGRNLVSESRTSL